MSGAEPLSEELERAIDRTLVNLSCERHICDEFCGTATRREGRVAILRAFAREIQDAATPTPWAYEQACKAVEKHRAALLASQEREKALAEALAEALEPFSKLDISGDPGTEAWDAMILIAREALRAYREARRGKV